MAVGMRYWSPEVAYQQLAVFHSSRAANIIVQRIESGQAHTDAVLLAVTSMAFGERLMRNDQAWNIHIDGLAQMVRERRSQGEFGLPPSFCDLCVLSVSLFLLQVTVTDHIRDSINDVLTFPRVYHKKIIEAVSAYGYRPISDVATISESLVQLRRSIDDHRRHDLGPDFVTEEIEEPLNRLLRQARALRVDDNPIIQATSLAIELVLYLSWRPQLGISPTAVASELKEALCRFQIRPCSYADMTSCQMMLGAISAEEGSQTRAWFMKRLKNAVLGMQSRGWDDPLKILKKSFMSDSGLMTDFRALWEELGCSSP